MGGGRQRPTGPKLTERAPDVVVSSYWVCCVRRSRPHMPLRRPERALGATQTSSGYPSTPQSLESPAGPLRGTSGFSTEEGSRG